MTVTVFDDDDSGTDTTTIAIGLGVVPTAVPDGPYGPVFEGSSVVVDGSGSFDDGVVVSHEWSSNEGSFGDPLMAVTEYSPTDEGSGIHTITLEVCDDDGLCGAGQAEVTVTNAVPMVTSVTSDGPVDEGSVVSVSASFTDAGEADIHTATIDWGEGPVMATVVQGAGSGTVSGDHTFAADGTFPVEVCVTDDDADVDCDSSLSLLSTMWRRRSPQEQLKLV